MTVRQLYPIYIQFCQPASLILEPTVEKVSRFRRPAPADGSDGAPL